MRVETKCPTKVKPFQGPESEGCAISYDIYFVPTGTRPDARSVRDWFSRQPFCNEIFSDPAVTQFEYVHPETHVEMMFDIEMASGPGPVLQDGGQASDAIVTLILNYGRPLYFAETAAKLSGDLMQAFGLNIYDPQEDAIWTAPLDQDAFVARYSDHAQQATQAILAAGATMLAAPAGRVRSVYDWNAQRDALQNAPEQEHFIPLIQWHVASGSLRTLFVWGDATLTRHPQTDDVLMILNELAPKRGLFRAAKPLFSVLSWQAYTELCGLTLKQDTDGTFFHDWAFADELAQRVASIDPKTCFDLATLQDNGPQIVNASDVIEADLIK